MSSVTLSAILLGALLHASWNVLVKVGNDSFLSAAFVAGSAAIVSAFALPFLGQPHTESWRYIGASMCSETIYYALVAKAYSKGDMSKIYPIMRGGAPLIVAVLSGPLIGESLSLARWVGVALISGGIFGFIVESRRLNTGSGIRYALLSAAMIATCTLIDAVGVRLSGAPAAYTMWIFLLSGVPIAAWASLRRGSEFIGFIQGRVKFGLAGGVCLIGSYGLALWAMTHAPVAAVAALRETSIVFATAIAAIVLKERMSWKRLAATAAVTTGALTIRLL
jgi:drug/metabolite transporter (DMT)-like permease